jgi:hypothetical protein
VHHSNKGGRWRAFDNKIKFFFRDLLRRYTRDHGLEIVKMGALEDMSGLNDAFNSSICSMHVTIKRSEAETEEEFNFVIKSPPSSSFIRMMHKFTRPFSTRSLGMKIWYLF